MFSAKLFSFSRLRDLLHNGNHLSLSLSRVCALFSSRRRGIPSALLVWLSRTQAKGELIHSSFFVFMHLWDPILQPLSFHIPPGMGGCTPPTPFGRWDVQTCGRSDESFRPIAVHILWCHNPQRHQISLRSGETTPLLPVSKTTRADIGNCSTPLPVTDSDSIGVASRAWVRRSRVSGFVLTIPELMNVEPAAGWLAFQRRVGKAGSVRLG